MATYTKSFDNYGIPDPNGRFAGCFSYYFSAAGDSSAVVIPEINDVSAYGRQEDVWIDFVGYDSATDANKNVMGEVVDVSGNHLFGIIASNKNSRYHSFPKPVRVPATRTPITLQVFDSTDWSSNKQYVCVWYTIGISKNATVAADFPDGIGSEPL